ncbi:DNA-binding transcriptional regulator, GntR family [Agromyces sp. CF514]|uniref:GntR family transcriptional regulator n=1 Tax=Agromyces sp. CF514 TaxID=1881031 RepID=UPI0008F2579C|nr:GntR family transcriptional regulator [Agromyces sp. CF514]SFR68842.1 DNA-binding transcriptional regulator, GntR family [Agromyces sp. CF514]
MAASKAEQAYAVLKARITDGTYGPGYRLVIDQLAREHGISSVPWRESLRRLEAEGWVEIVPNVGALVRTFDAHAFERTIRLLARLEGLATAVSAPHLTPADLAEARAFNAQMAEALASFDTNLFGRLNRRFHEVLCSKSDDTRLNELLANEWARLDFIRRSAYWHAPGRAQASVAEHEELVALIERGADPDEIETAARQHEVNTLVAVTTYDAALAGHTPSESLLA